jgi:prepilin-type N-terminal cleavage/methylation domain-containing protein
MKQNQRGLTLLEVMISVLIFSMISVLIFSILDRSAAFTAKGDKRVRTLEQNYNLSSLIRRQVQGAWIDQKQQKAGINQLSDLQISIITTSSIMYPPTTLVIAFYDFDEESGTLFYTERRDFYNQDYNDQFPPIEEMIPLLVTDQPFRLQTTEESNLVSLTLAGKQYTFHPFCLQQDEEIANAPRS